MKPRFETITTKKLVGVRGAMSLSHYTVGELWRVFMPRRKEVVNSVSTDLFSVAVYPSNYFADVKPTLTFERWAAVEVSDFDHIPVNMEAFELSGGLYAIFRHIGVNTDKSIYQYIYGTWLPATGYVLDERPHFEVLGNNYRNNDPLSEEEIWIPIKAH